MLRPENMGGFSHPNVFDDGAVDHLTAAPARTGSSSYYQGVQGCRGIPGRHATMFDSDATPVE